MKKTFAIGTASQKQPGGLFPGSAKDARPASAKHSAKVKLEQPSGKQGRG